MDKTDFGLEKRLYGTLNPYGINMDINRKKVINKFMEYKTNQNEIYPIKIIKK